MTITEKTVSMKKEKITMVGGEETRVVENSPTFVENLFPVTDAYEGETVKLDSSSARFNFENFIQFEFTSHFKIFNFVFCFILNRPPLFLKITPQSRATFSNQSDLPVA